MRLVPSVVPVALLLAACNQEHGVRRLHVPPEAAIVTPEPEQIFRLGNGDLVFEGTAVDSYDGPSDLDAFWRIDDLDEVATDVAADGTVTFAFDASPLPLGEHTVVLRVVDGDGDEGVAEATWVLDGAVSAPLVEITAPDEGAEFPDATEVTFRGTASDNNTPVDELVWTWTADGAELPGAITASGESVVFATLPVGAHVVTLTVSDRDGEIGEDTVNITILGEPDPEPEPEPEPEPVAQIGDLVFSELNVNPIGVQDEVGEWVELYNTSSTPIQIQGYAFHDLGTDTYTIVGSAIVPAFDYVVLCASLDPVTNGGISCDVAFAREGGGPGFMALGNDGDEVVLSRPDGVAIDQVVYDGTWFTPGAATGLDPDQLDADNNDDETMWCDQTSALASGELGTPGAVNDDCP